MRLSISLSLHSVSWHALLSGSAQLLLIRLSLLGERVKPINTLLLSGRDARSWGCRIRSGSAIERVVGLRHGQIGSELGVLLLLLLDTAETIMLCSWQSWNQSGVSSRA
jgi:hypothetical protein